MTSERAVLAGGCFWGMHLEQYCSLQDLQINAVFLLKSLTLRLLMHQKKNGNMEQMMLTGHCNYFIF